MDDLDGQLGLIDQLHAYMHACTHVCMCMYLDRQLGLIDQLNADDVRFVRVPTRESAEHLRQVSQPVSQSVGQPASE